MHFKSVLILASIAMVLAFTGIQGAFAASTFAHTQSSALYQDSNNDFYAQWTGFTADSLTVTPGTSLLAKGSWTYDATEKSETTDAIYFAYCPGLATSSYVWDSYQGVLGNYGDSMTKTNNNAGTAGSSTGTYSYQLSLGYYPNDEGYTCFANPMQADTLVIS